MVKGNESLITDFAIDDYPTVIIIDSDGSIIFKGAIENAEKVIENPLNK